MITKKEIRTVINELKKIRQVFRILISDYEVQNVLTRALYEKSKNLIEDILNTRKLVRVAKIELKKCLDELNELFYIDGSDGYKLCSFDDNYTVGAIVEGMILIVETVVL